MLRGKWRLIILTALMLVLVIVLPAQAMELGQRTLKYSMRGDDVSKLQQELKNHGYYPGYRIDGYFGPVTLREVKKFQSDQGIVVDGIVGQQTISRLMPKALIRAIHTVQRGDTLWLLAQWYGTTVQAIRNVNNVSGDMLYIGQTINIPAADRVNEAQLSRGGRRLGELISWDKAKNIFAMYDYAVVTDVRTGISFKVQRRGGSKHADVQPLTAADTAKMKQLYGQWSWGRRAILVTVNGRTMAASMNGMPHGAGAIKGNNFPGHFCIHFLGSRTHGTNSLDPDHQYMVRVAAGIS